jgi:hypothetical protein
VERSPRPDGATFSAPCGGPLTGRGVQVDVEANPPRIISSSKSTDGYVSAGGLPGSDTAPITFPWTVSLTDPLLLYVVASADTCYCVWTAEIPWVSGSEKGTVEIDNEGRGYAVVGIDRLAGYTISGTGWREFRAVGELSPG